jgi:hypothetical protein
MFNEDCDSALHCGRSKEIGLQNIRTCCWKVPARMLFACTSTAHVRMLAFAGAACARSIETLKIANRKIDVEIFSDLVDLRGGRTSC